MIMNRIFIRHQIFCFLLISIALLNVKEASSCEAKAPDTMLISLLSRTSFEFGFKLHNSLQGGGKNLFISPFSVLMTFTMTDEGGAEITFNHVKRHPPKLMNNAIPLMTEMKMAFQHYLHTLCSNNKLILSVANRIYLRNPLPLVNRTFIQTLKDFFWSGAEDVDFGNNPNGVAKYINQWVEQQTVSTIKDLISLRSLSPEPVELFVNTVNFNGKWKIPFDLTQTMPRTFTLANGQPIQVPTMFVRNRFKYDYNGDYNCHILQLNYVGGGLAMLIVLPENGANLTAVQHKLTYGKNDFMSNLSVQLVEVYLPKFKASLKEALDDPISNGSVLHGWPRMDLNGKNITAPKVKVEHETLVVVDEAGSMSAAGTAFALHLQSAPLLDLIPSFHRAIPPVNLTPYSLIQFKVDRPCFYLIFDIRFKHILLFIGRLDDPAINF